jgi:hypothetical protein
MIEGIVGGGGHAGGEALRPCPGSLRANKHSPSTNKQPSTTTTTNQTTQQLLWSEGGVKRFYKGFTPCIIRAAPANAAMLFTVDRVTAMLASK